MLIIRGSFRCNNMAQLASGLYTKTMNVLLGILNGIIGISFCVAKYKTATSYRPGYTLHLIEAAGQRKLLQNLATSFALGRGAMLLTVVLCSSLLAAVLGEPANQFKDLLLNKHNEFRKMQKGSNMNKLVWSDTLAQEADAWIARCNFEHQNKGRGENLAFNTKDDDIANINQAMQDWYDEIKTYNYAGKKCGMSCHYTQLVWSQTREVGCAIRKCPSLTAFGKSVKNGWYLGCWYDPKGNDNTEYPYLTGAPCSSCLEGQTCEDGLCAGVGKEVCEDKKPECVSWEASGSCTSNKAYMVKYCRQACGLCEGGAPRECKDVSPKCEVFKKTCESNKSWMKPNCMKTCGFCTDAGKREDFQDYSDIY